MIFIIAMISRIFLNLVPRIVSLGFCRGNKNTRGY